MDYEEFSNFLRERAQEKNLGTKRLSELTGVSVKHLEAILSGDPARLPSVPYLKGYLTRLGEVLDFDPDEAWEEMKKMAAPKSSGKSDAPPQNRFSRRPIGKYAIWGVIASLVLAYLAVRLYEISGTPVLKIYSPEENMTAVEQNFFAVSGRASNANEVKVNGEFVQLRPDGGWEKTVFLQNGINTIEISAGKFLGRETKIIRQIIYKELEQSVSSTDSGSGGF